MSEINDLVKSKLAHLEQLQKLGINPYPYSFKRSHLAKQLHDQFGHLKPEQETREPQVNACGRITSIRRFGKLAFLDLTDGSGKIQVQLREKDTDSKSLELAELLDRGDFLGVHGHMIRTKRGELTVLATEIEILSKSVLPLPEKWHGLQDVETRYRQRYVDLAMNPEVRTVFETRSKIISAMREFLDKEGFTEVEIPLLQPVYGGANAKPFKTFSNALNQELFLSISPELYLKRLIGGGMDKVYTITKNFRNEDIDKTHNPEFTMMEFYASYWDYSDVMQCTERMIEFISQKVLQTTKVNYQGTQVELKTPWTRITVNDTIKKFAQIDVTRLSDKELEKKVLELKPDYDGPRIRGLLIAELFAETCEKHLVQPTFVIDYPKETTPLCKPHRKNPELIERTEPFINGWEIGNAYSELNDPILQRKVLEQQAREGRAGGTQEPVDEDYIHAMEYGMPPIGGIGIGIDRLTMLLTNQLTIKDVILFPQMKTGWTQTKTISKAPAKKETKTSKPVAKTKTIAKKKK